MSLMPDPTQAKPRSLGSLRLLGEVMYTCRYRLLCGAGLILLTTLLTTLAPMILRQAVDGALTYENLQAFTHAVMQLALLIVLIAASIFAGTIVLRRAGDLMITTLRARVFNHLTQLPPDFYDESRTGALLSRLVADTEAIRRSVSLEVPNSLVGLITLIFGGIYLLVLNSTLTFYLSLVALVTVPVMWFLGVRMRPLSRALQDKVADLSTFAEENLSQMRTVQAYNRQPQAQHEFSTLMTDYLTTAWQHTLAFAQLMGAASFLQFSGYLLVFALGGWQVVQGVMTPGELVAYVAYVVMIGTSFQHVAHLWPFLQTAAGATERLFDILRTTSSIHETTQPQSLPGRNGGRAITFTGVTFTYPSRPQEAAIHHLTLEVNPNERIAIVGPSGAGKTTLFQLLLRFYDPQQGSITIDGVPISQLRLHHLRDQMALVSQDPVVFATSVLENIRYGRPGAGDAEVMAAAEAAFADRFIAKLPQGYHTLLGERGVKLSGGERQRIAIARAILCNPAILLLDEATSNLDAEAEALVQQALNQLMQHRTTLVIAHRLSTVVNADRIVLLDKGQLVAQGTHTELLQRAPLYKKLAELQFGTELPA